MIFKDPELQARFEHDGYVVVDLLSPDEAARIADKFYELHHEIPGGFYSTASSTDDGFKKSMQDHAEQILAPNMDAVFQDFKKLGIAFLCKAPGENGKVPVHRDWTVVDESKYFSGTVWIPTVDTTEENGALRVLPGSHKFFDDLRSSSLPAAFEGHEKQIWDQMIVVPMKAGQAFLLNHAVIHASSPNITDKERLVIVCGIIPAEAKLMYYHGTNNGTVEKFDMPDDMFMSHFDIGGRPAVGIKVEEFKYCVKRASGLKIQHLITTSKAERVMKRLFKNEAFQEQFAKNGYIKLPVLTAAEVEDLVSMLDITYEGVLTEQITEKIRALISSKAAFNCENIQFFDTRLEIKRKSTDELGPLIQDWTYTDNEDEYCSVTCWIPLADLNIESGTWGFVKGSHLFVGNKRASPRPQASFVFKGSGFDVLPYLQTIDLKVGEPIIFDHRIFKSVLPNRSREDVSGISIRFTHLNARLCHFYLNPDGNKDKALKYKVDEAFFQKYDTRKLSSLYESKKRMSGYEPVEIINYSYSEFTTDELTDLLKETGCELNKPLIAALSNLPGYKKYLSQKEHSQVSDTGKVYNAATEKSNNTKQDDNNFWQKYTLLNIVREIKKRVIGY